MRKRVFKRLHDVFAALPDRRERGFYEEIGSAEVPDFEIGTFTRDETGAYAGTIKPCDRDNDPDFRVTAVVSSSEQAGAARPAKRAPNTSRLKLDDPSFTAPVYASLVQGDKGEHKLIWSR